MTMDQLGTAIGWLPGAGIGTLGGIVAGALSFDTLATRCPVGDPFVGIGGTTSQLSTLCVVTPLGEPGLAGFVSMVAVLGALVGIVVNLVVVAVRNEE